MTRQVHYFRLTTLFTECLLQIARTVTHVVHNAWKVDFNHVLKSFEPLIASTRRFIDACYTFSHPVRLLYTSSVSAAAGYDTSRGPVPEEPLVDPEVAVATGYGASKFVVENVRVLHETLNRLFAYTRYWN